MRAEQKLLLAAGLIGCGIAGSLLFRADDPARRNATDANSRNAPELTLRLRRESTVISENSGETDFSSRRDGSDASGRKFQPQFAAERSADSFFEG